MSKHTKTKGKHTTGHPDQRKYGSHINKMHKDILLMEKSVPLNIDAHGMTLEESYQFMLENKAEREKIINDPNTSPKEVKEQKQFIKKYLNKPIKEHQRQISNLRYTRQHELRH